MAEVILVGGHDARPVTRDVFLVGIGYGFGVSAAGCRCCAGVLERSIRADIYRSGDPDMLRAIWLTAVK